MDLKQIKELIAAMGRGGIKKLTIKEKTGYELHLERHEERHEERHGEHPSHSHAPAAYAYHTFSPPHHVSVAPVKEVEVTRPVPTGAPASKQLEEKTGRYITAPLVGTFYHSPSPDDPPFVKVGDRVEENSVVCIIEAMKVMNEVKAGVSGIVEEILIENAHPVEFGSKMFRIV